MSLRSVAIALLATLLCVTTFAATPPIPKVTNAPAITQSNPIWMASQLPLSRWGYIEEEFFIEGNANIYKALTAPAEITSTVPYKTRILVRRPADTRRYSGNIVLEPIHPGRTVPALATTFRWIYGNGDVWVGVEPPGNIPFLKQYNPTRYASLTPVPNLTVHDSLAQVSALLQSSSSPIQGLQVRDVFMQGISATCGVVSQFINMLHRETTLANGKPIVSGYMPGECTAALPDINVPVIRITTQYDFNASNRKPDSDDPKGRFRLYELTGSAHFSTNNPLFGVPVSGMARDGRHRYDRRHDHLQRVHRAHLCHAQRFPGLGVFRRCDEESSGMGAEGKSAATRPAHHDRCERKTCDWTNSVMQRAGCGPRWWTRRRLHGMRSGPTAIFGDTRCPLLLRS